MTAEQTKRFKYWQWRTIIGTMIGYAIFYFVRKNFSFAIPGLTAEYGISKTTFGVIMTLVGLIYGVSKFVNGVLADRTNGRWHMVTGLSVCSVINFIFGCGAIICAWITGQTYGTTFIHTLVVLFGVLLILNNMFQGCGFPPCNRLITHWVPPKELATKMSIWNASHSIGAFIIAILCGYLMGHTGTDMTGDPEMRQRVVENTASITEKMDAASAEAYVTNALQHVGAWQWTFWVPAAIAVLGVIFIIVTLRDTPKSVGLPELEGTKTQLDEHDSSEEFKAFLRKKVFLNPMIWGLAVADFFVYIVRFAVLDWGRGVWTYHNTWYWGSASGELDGVPFGWNIGYGFGNTEAATENVLFYDGRIHKLSEVRFEIPMDEDGFEDFMKPWVFTSDDNRFYMNFTPVLDRSAFMSAGVVLSDQHQVFGRFTGRITLDDGTVLPVRDFFGFAEKVENKW